MPSTGLESLPLLPLERICEYLADIELYRDSLYAFSLTSKSCCIAANQQRFERIHLHIDGSAKLEADLAKWNLVLGHRGRKHVRKLKVSGGMSLDPVSDGSVNDAGRLEYELEQKEEDYHRSASDWFLEQPSIPVSYSIPVEKDDNDKRVMNGMWKPLAQFVTELPGLMDMVWNSHDEVPVCIVEVIDGSRTRLRMHALICRSLVNDSKIPNDMDLDEYQIATSSNLTQISVSYRRHHTSSNHFDFGLEMVLRMVAQSAPNLKNVCLKWWPSTTSDLEVKPCCAPYPPDLLVKIDPKWTEIPSDHDDSITKGHLKVLDIQGSDPLCAVCVSQWHRHTHFQDLQRLKICLESGSLQLMVQLAQAGSFQSLRDLSLEVRSLNHDDNSSDLCSLFAALSPLTSLSSIYISHLDVWRTIFQHHGRTLRRLITSKSLSREHIEIMPQYCSSLEILEFELHRSGGDRHEVDCYRALGMLPRLERLILHLSCRIWDPNSPSAVVQPGRGIYTDEERLHFIRLAAINNAIDADLARAIYKLISDKQATVNHSPRIPFSYLRLRVSPVWHIGREINFRRIGLVLGRSWDCARDPRDTHADQVHTHEIDTYMRKSRSDLFEKPLTASRFGHLFEKVWKELWPEGTGHWADSWHSLPLASIQDPEPRPATEGVRA